MPTVDSFKDACDNAVNKLADRLGPTINPATLEMIGTDAAMQLYTATLLHGGEMAAWHQADFHKVRSTLRGLVLEEFQKTKRMLVAECPRRVQLLCEKLFEVDQPSTTFAYFDKMNESDTLQRMSCVESLPDHIQPRVLSRKRSWRLPHASAPTGIKGQA